MKYHITIFFMFAVGFLFAPIITGAEENKPPESVAILDSTPGNFEEDVSEAGTKMKEALRMMRRNKFFRSLFTTIENRDIKKAERLLGEQIREFPEYKKDANYRVAKSKIAYAKGDYQTAYAEADNVVADIEKAFAPRKPYEINFRDEDTKEAIRDSYILRYQAAGQMLRYEEALADLNCVLRIKVTADGLSAKTGVLLALNRYAEAANTSDKTYDMDKTIFMSSPYRNHYCWVFSEQGYKVKDCSYFAALARERAAREKKAQ